MLDPPPVATADILRVHEANYYIHLKEILEQVDPDRISMLDRDTSVSAKSWDAAIHAAGAVIYAVDKVLAGKNRNAFCPVRPPGHHVGAFGAVSSDMDHS
jgi:acetoin utilization deacetylase AcuC-like enzyme